jgi:IS5 family transposase
MSDEKKKVQYGVRNWREYNQALVQRGSLTLWFEEKTVESWLNSEPTGKRGHPYVYSDVAVECMLLLKQVYHLALRQTQGFMQSIFHLVEQELPVLSYSQLSRRQQDLKIDLPRQKRGQGLHVVVDATGLKVYGEGEWKTRQHGIGKRRTWRKVHLAFDAETQEVVAEVTTENNVHEKEKMPDLLAQIEEEVAQVSADTGYDYQTCYQAIADKQARAVIPPRRNGRVWANGQMDDRDDNLRRIAVVGRDAWKQESDYHQRSLAETGMFRLKKIFGPGLLARHLKRQQTEVRVRCVALNRMTALGMPDSYPLGLA